MNLLGLYDYDNDAVRHRRHREPRLYMERQNFFDGADFKQRFRISQHTVDELEERIGRLLEPSTRCNQALSPREQILTCLRFFATNGFYHLVRDAHGPSEATVCCVVKKVTRAINETLFRETVKWPDHPQSFCQQFYQMHGMPSVCGLIDGSLVTIKKPKDNEAQFIDRKGKHSLNCLFVCGPNHQFVYCNPCWPGSVHDARVLRTANIYQSFQINNFRPFPGAVLLGDSGYPCLDWLIPPVAGDNLPFEAQEFNRAHRQTRSLVERAIGLLKIRFPVLNKMRVKTPEYSAEIVKACTVLHNLCIIIEGNVEDDVVMQYVQERINEMGNDVDVDEHNEENQGRRRELIATFAN